MKTILLAGILSVGLAANCFGAKVLILSTTVSGGNGSREADIASKMGFTVDIVTPKVWSNMSLDDFKTYQAIILGDPSCLSVTSIAPAELNASLWGQAIKGNVIIVGTDPTVHPNPGGGMGGTILISNAISFATAQAGKTGLYCCLSCYYWNSGLINPVPVLSGIGTFEGVGIPGCYNKSHIVATSPVMKELSDTSLSDWGCSVHEGFTSWPASFTPVAIARDSGTAYTASDLSVGTPYILASGTDLTPVTSGITLSPDVASNPTNTTHTVCATVAENSAPAVGATVTFNIISGPNAGVSVQAVTGTSGTACFTYPGVGGVGMDTITASAVDASSQPVVATVSSATKTWFDPCGPNLLGVILGIAPCGSNVINLIFNEDPTVPGATNVSNYTVNNGLNVTNVTLVSGSGFMAVVQVDGNLVPGTPYTMSIDNLVDYCGRSLTPNPTVLNFTCKPNCSIISCPSNIFTQCTGPGGATVSFTVSVPEGCTNSTIVTFPTSPHLFPAGTNFVNALLFGPGSNNCSFEVVVSDSVPPVIQCPSNLVINTSCPDNPIYFDVGVTDNCCLASIVCTPPSGSSFPIGTTTVNCTAYDCSGNSNSCSFTITMNQIGDAGLPTIISCPTNIYVCTNGADCAAMPDVTGDVQATDGEETFFVSQSIPVGTPICSNTNITLTVSNLCGDYTNLTANVLVGPCDCAPILTMPWPSLPAKIIVVVGQGPGPETRHEFTLNPFDPGLTNIPGGPTLSYADFDDQDFMGYDVYLSDPAGNFESNGCCVSIVCYDNNASTDFDTGNNIDAVELQFADGTIQAADHVGSVQLGGGLSNPTLIYDQGMAANALGFPDKKVTYLGNGLSRITVCFSTPSSPYLRANSSIRGGQNINLGWSDPFLRPWKVISSTNLSDWTTLSIPFNATNFRPVTITNIVNITNNVAVPFQFYRLTYRTN